MGHRYIFLCLLVSFFLATPALTSASPCDRLPFPPSQRIANAIFPFNLTPFGEACFVAHIIADPNPDNELNQGNGSLEPYIALSLIRNGKIIYQYPYPDPVLWDLTVDGIVSVAFRKLGHDKYTDVVIIGHSEAANGSDIYMPLIYRATGTGFLVDNNLSLAMADKFIPDMPDLLRAIQRNPNLKP